MVWLVRAAIRITLCPRHVYLGNRELHLNLTPYFSVLIPPNSPHSAAVDRIGFYRAGDIVSHQIHYSRDLFLVE